MTIHINHLELEALIEERLRTGDFRDLEELLLYALGGDAVRPGPVPPAAGIRRLEKESGVWVLRTGQSISPTVVEDTLDAIRGSGIL